MLTYLFFALAPSAIWLAFFLQKDAHPESKRAVARIFFWGMLAGFPAIFLEVGIFKLIQEGLAAGKGYFLFFESIGRPELAGLSAMALYMFLGVGLTEEFLKYLVVRDKILRDSEFDEPADAIIYMITAAMGFAALENMLFLWPGKTEYLFIGSLLSDSSARFLGATFLHALASGAVGYFLALAVSDPAKSGRRLAAGLLLAAGLHGLYNFSIIAVEGSRQEKLAIPALVLAVLAAFLFFAFKKVKKMDSVCRTGRP